MNAIVLWLLMFADTRLIDTPTTWTANPIPYEEMIGKPEADSCAYWGAQTDNKHCSAYIVLGSSPRNLRCKTDERYNNVVHCVWDLPVKR